MSNYLDEDDPKRNAEPVDDDIKIERIEIDFAIPVYVTQEQQRQLNSLLESICRAPVNTPTGGVHWLAGWGSKAKWSKTDAQIFGWETSEDAPESGEPTFDDTVLHGESCARMNNPEKCYQCGQMKIFSGEFCDDCTAANEEEGPEVIY